MKLNEDYEQASVVSGEKVYWPGKLLFICRPQCRAELHFFLSCYLFNFLFYLLIINLSTSKNRNKCTYSYMADAATKRGKVKMAEEELILNLEGGNRVE